MHFQYSIALQYYEGPLKFVLVSMISELYFPSHAYIYSIEYSDERVLSKIFVFCRYEDDPIIGHRLYREIRKVEIKKGKGKNVPSIPYSSYQWEAVSTNLDEFQTVSVSRCVRFFLSPFSALSECQILVLFLISIILIN